MKCTCIYYNDNDDMQSLHFATCSFKPFASLDSICFYTVPSLSFVISQKYIVRITFRSIKREQTAETDSRYFHWNTSKLSPFQQETIVRSHPIPYIHFWRDISFEECVLDDCLCYISVGNWMITSDLGIYHWALASEHPWRIHPSSKWR